jgi:hypothetical protein
VKRFADAGVLAAVADSVTATTLITSEGRALTEVKLQIQNRAQPFLKVALPAGATMASVEVAGQPAKPALGTDGTRVPLLRPGLRPTGPYQVSFVYLHAGTPFAKKGELDMGAAEDGHPGGARQLGAVRPRALQDERHRRERARCRRGEPAAGQSVARGVYKAGGSVSGGVFAGVADSPPSLARVLSEAALAGGVSSELRASPANSSGAVLPGVTVEATSPSLVDKVRSGVTDGQGQFRIAGLPPGEYHVDFILLGFNMARLERGEADTVAPPPSWKPNCAWAACRRR